MASRKNVPAVARQFNRRFPLPATAFDLEDIHVLADLVFNDTVDSIIKTGIDGEMISTPTAEDFFEVAKTLPPDELHFVRLSSGQRYDSPKEIDLVLASNTAFLQVSGQQKKPLLGLAAEVQQWAASRRVWYGRWHLRWLLRAVFTIVGSLSVLALILLLIALASVKSHDLGRFFMSWRFWMIIILLSVSAVTTSPLGYSDDRFDRIFPVTTIRIRPSRHSLRGSNILAGLGIITFLMDCILFYRTFKK